MKRLLLAMLTAGFVAGAGAQELFQGYTCCNLHYDSDWISDANWAQLPMIPAGAPIKVLSYGSNRVSVEIDGKPFRIGQDYGRNEESLEKYISKLVVKSNPKAKIERYPDKVRAAIRMGRVIPGMTHEQALISVGYPPTHQTRTLDARVWNHWQSRAGRYEIHWTEKGSVEKVVGWR
jgi:hypothetical protein